MNPFMSSVGVICKDDNTGSARVFVTKGTPPFSFVWEKDSSIEQYNDIYAPVDSFSLINNLSPGVYP